VHGVGLHYELLLGRTFASLRTRQRHPLVWVDPDTKKIDPSPRLSAELGYSKYYASMASDRGVEGDHHGSAGGLARR
jgi:hypothetical protein